MIQLWTTFQSLAGMLFSGSVSAMPTGEDASEESSEELAVDGKWIRKVILYKGKFN